MRGEASPIAAHSGASVMDGITVRGGLLVSYGKSLLAMLVQGCSAERACITADEKLNRGQILLFRAARKCFHFLPGFLKVST